MDNIQQIIEQTQQLILYHENEEIKLDKRLTKTAMDVKDKLRKSTLYTNLKQDTKLTPKENENEQITEQEEELDEV